MRRVFSGILMLLAGAVAGVMIGLFLPAEPRLKVSRHVAATIERRVEQMPEV